MIWPPDLLPWVSVATAAMAGVAFFIDCSVCRRSGTGLFLCSLAISGALALSATSMALGEIGAAARPALEALNDLGLLLAGVAAYTAACWLDSVSGMDGWCT